MTFQPGKRSLHIPGLGHGNTPIPMGARVGNLLCSSGINGADASSGQLPADPLAQVKHAFANLKSLLSAGGASLADVVKLTVYLKDGHTPTVSQKAMRDAINVEWVACFPDADDRPARHILLYELQNGMALQLEVTAMIQGA
jgi:2-iminobutanoate/2-iminopropanoate deaminase